MKTLKDMTFEELVEEASRSALSELLKEGGQGLRSSMYRWMETTLRWREAQVAEQKKWKRGKRS